VLKHYGLKTLLYGVLLPGPHIGRRCAAQLEDIARRGFEVGVHTWDHVSWQDRVARASEPWTRRELTLACDQFVEIFGQAPLVHGAPDGRPNRYVPALQRELGFHYASDTRGTGPFVPLLDHGAAAVPQLPTTLPTLDELIGRAELRAWIRSIMCWPSRPPCPRAIHVFTLHAELEGGAYLPSFERLLRAWQRRGTRLTDWRLTPGNWISAASRAAHRGRHGRGALGHAGVAVAMEEVKRLRFPGGALGLIAALLGACAHYTRTRAPLRASPSTLPSAP